jgi:hypothetical protein
LGVARLGLVTDGAHDVGLTVRFVEGVAQDFTIDGQAFIDRAIVYIPVLKGLVEFLGIHPDQDIAQAAFAGHPILALAVESFPI